MSCSTHIVECLREKHIEPFAFSNSERETRKAIYALNYTKENNFCSINEEKAQWWIVDFKRIVAINRYQFCSESSTNWLSGWTFSISLNNKTWILVDSPVYQYPGDKVFNLDNTVNARFVKINGGSPMCTVENHDRTVLAFYYIKFFGSLFPIPTKNNRTCKRVFSEKYISLVLVLLIS